MERMKILQKKDLTPGRSLESYLCLDPFFIVLSRYSVVSQQDLNLIESHDLLRMIQPGEGAHTTDDEREAGSGPMVHGSEPGEVPAEAPPHERGGESDRGEERPPDRFGETEEEADEEADYEDILKLWYRELVSISRGSRPDQDAFLTIASCIRYYAINNLDDALDRVSRGCARNKTVRHQVHTGVLCALIGRAMGKDERELPLLVAGALVHDVGILLLAEKGAADDLRQHTVLGYQFLREADIHPRIATPALQHHETAGGTGYPRGLRLWEMTEESRVVALCDNWDNQLNLVKHGWDVALHYSRREFLRWRMDDYDRRLIRLFFSVLGSRAARGGTVLLNDGRRAEVLSVSPRFPLNPVVRSEDGETIDLRKAKRFWIAGTGQITL